MSVSLQKKASKLSKDQSNNIGGRTNFQSSDVYREEMLLGKNFNVIFFLFL